MISLNPRPQQHLPKSKKVADLEADIRSHTKELLMEFHNYDKSELGYVLELCEYNLTATQTYLRLTSKKKVKETITKFLTGKIEPDVTALGIPLDNLNLKDNKEEAKAPEEAKKEEEEFIPTGPNLFNIKLTDELIHYLLDFLDPSSLGKAGFTCKRFHEISMHPLLFRKFCKKLYSQYPPLPTSSPFNSLQQRILAAGRFEFEPSVISQATKDIRSLVWIPNIKTFYTPASYYKQFKGMRDVFLHAPRVRFGGVYVMKEKYLRSGTKELTGFYDPYHVVEFYRYLRFFPNGLVMSTLCVNRLKKDKLVKMFSPNSDFMVEEQENIGQNSALNHVLQGEYVVQKASVHIRLNAKSTIYEFELEIGSTAPGFFDRLKMISQHMRVVGSEYSEALQNRYMGSKMFKFDKVPEIVMQLDKNVVG